ncbi:MAG: carbohydate-binding domain-containing protein [Proteobacteria bacterium]|nr:carbohydate-binding domain-containing protein [Pseudomonadota bacterium]
MASRRRGARLLRLAAALLCAAPLGPACAADGAAGAPLALRWEQGPADAAVVVPKDGAPARFTLTATGPGRLPARGWSLYFNCEEGVQAGAASGGFTIEQVAGTFYRMYPGPGFNGLGPGQSVSVSFAMLGVAHNPLQAPIGPYYALDDAPASAVSIGQYTLAPIAATAQTRTPEQTYERNASITAMPPESLPPVLPTPRLYTRGGGTLHWASMPAITASPGLGAEVSVARAMLVPYLRAPGAPQPQHAASLRLQVARLAGERSPEGYELRVDPLHGVSVRGNTAAGVARGLESLRQLLPLSPTDDLALALPELRIEDAPRFAYRGLMLDVARNFQPKAAVLRVLDLMARYKLNVFHFHLTDDEGWRLDIPGLPELTGIGARRGHMGIAGAHLPPAYGSGPDVHGAMGSGYYTRADYIEILRHAAARHIEVIPEIEMPGHARAAVVAMAERARQRAAQGQANADEYLLYDRADQSVYSSAQHYRDNVMNPALPSTYAFIAHVIDEVSAMHRAAGVPLRTLHVGGDELPAGAWQRSPACAELMRREHLASRDELWDYFYGRVARLLRNRGVRTAGWEELGTRRERTANGERVEPNPAVASRGYTLYVWRNIEGADDLAYRLANAGFDTVLTPASRLYIDMSPYPSPDEGGQTWAAYVDLDTVFDYIPFDDNRVSPDNPMQKPGMQRLDATGRQHVLGIEAPLFGETLNEPARLGYMLLPRLLAAAERAWAPDPAWTSESDPERAARSHAAAWSVFVNKLGRDVLPRLDADFPDLRYRLPPPGLKRADGVVWVNEQIPGLTLRYTIDGSMPDAQSPEVHGPIVANGTVRVAAFDRRGRAGRAAQLDAARAEGPQVR